MANGGSYGVLSDDDIADVMRAAERHGIDPALALKAANDHFDPVANAKRAAAIRQRADNADWSSVTSNLFKAFLAVIVSLFFVAGLGVIGLVFLIGSMDCFMGC